MNKKEDPCWRKNVQDGLVRTAWHYNVVRDGLNT